MVKNPDMKKEMSYTIVDQFASRNTEEDYFDGKLLLEMFKCLQKYLCEQLLNYVIFFHNFFQTV